MGAKDKELDCNMKKRKVEDVKEEKEELKPSQNEDQNKPILESQDTLITAKNEEMSVMDQLVDILKNFLEMKQHIEAQYDKTMTSFQCLKERESQRFQTLNEKHLEMETRVRGTLQLSSTDAQSDGGQKDASSGLFYNSV